MGRGGQGRRRQVELTMPLARTSAGTVRYEVEGEGPDLALVHELGGSLASFDGLIPALRRAYRVLRYDQSGCGGSPAAARPLSIDDQAALLDEMMRAAGCGPRCRLAGVAAGAAIAASLALARPERVAALALCAPALAVPAERRAYLDERSGRALAAGMTAIVEPSLARSYPTALRADAGRFERYCARFLATDPASYAQANRALARMRIEDRLHELGMPCLVLAGRHDLLRPPAELAALATRIPGARFATLDSGHLMSVQAPDEMAGHLLAFFAGCGADAGAHADA